MTDKIIDFNQVKKNKERREWREVLDYFEKKVDDEADSTPMTEVEKKGNERLKLFIEKLREKHMENEDEHQ